MGSGECSRLLCFELNDAVFSLEIVALDIANQPTESFLAFLVSTFDSIPC